MFGLDLTSLKLMRWQIQRADAAPARYAVTVVDWHGVPTTSSCTSRRPSSTI